MALRALLPIRRALKPGSQHAWNSVIFARGFAAGDVQVLPCMPRPLMALFATCTLQDVVVIGGGPGGYVAAIKAGQLGLKVTCIEGRGSLGGTCLNVGCIPSKVCAFSPKYAADHHRAQALLHSSHMYEEARHVFAKHGVLVDGVKVDVPAMMKQKDEAVTGLTKGIEGLFKKNKVTYIKGWGSFKSPTEIQVAQLDGSSTTVQTKNTIIATGSDVLELPGIPIDENKIVSSTGALKLEKVPESLIVIGGGYIGLEMGSVWGRLGAKVTVVEFLDRIVPTMDSEIRRNFQRSLEKQGFSFKLSTKVVSASVESDKVKLVTEPAKGGAQESMEADVVLVSAGRKPHTQDLGLDKIGVEVDQRGRVKVDSKFQTTVPGVFAIGDVIPGPMLAHKAEEDGVACVENIAGRHGHVNYDTVPSIVYTSPEVAGVGLTEDQAKEQGLDYKVGKFSFMANSRARAVNTAEGLVKFIADKKTDKLLGVQIMGPNAGELIAECVLALEYGASAEDIARTCHGHPTLSEAIKEAALATFEKPIHS